MFGHLYPHMEQSIKHGDGTYVVTGAVDKGNIPLTEALHVLLLLKGLAFATRPPAVN